MKSCRNCANSTHVGTYIWVLACKFNVNKPLHQNSLVETDNLKTDERLRYIASDCGAYKEDTITN